MKAKVTVIIEIEYNASNCSKTEFKLVEDTLKGIYYNYRNNYKDVSSFDVRGIEILDEKD